MNDLRLATFVQGHATHPDALMALALVAAQIDAQCAHRAGFVPNLGLLYLSDHFSAQAEAVLADAARRWPGVTLAGTNAWGLAASGVEYADEPALVLMMAQLPARAFRVFHGRQPLVDGEAWTALVHADPATHDLGELITELAGRTGSGVLFGGLSSARTGALHWAGGLFRGGLSGLAFGPEVPIISRVTQGCQPIGPVRRVTAAERNLVLELDGRPALACLLDDLGLGLDPPDPLIARLRQTLVGLTDAGDQALDRGGQFGADTRVRSLIGLDTARQAVAVGDWVEPGMRLSFCQRHVEAARRDLVRICSEIREELEGDDPARRRGIAGAIYISCTGRGGDHFGAPSAELQLVRHALGEVPLVGFFAAGEIAHHHLVGYTGVLTVFADPGA